jgi:hypothetical protein
MILGYHLILTAYGFWLPNDPRGSWSTFVRQYALYRAGGAATKVNTRRSLAHEPVPSSYRTQTNRALRHPPVRFTGQQALAIAAGLRDYAQRRQCVIHACAILPDHVHLVLARHRLPI